MAREWDWFICTQPPRGGSSAKPAGDPIQSQGGGYGPGISEGLFFFQSEGYCCLNSTAAHGCNGMDGNFQDPQDLLTVPGQSPCPATIRACSPRNLAFAPTRLWVCCGAYAPMVVSELFLSALVGVGSWLPCHCNDVGSWLPCHCNDVGFLCFPF
jgi:hypothetical protein